MPYVIRSSSWPSRESCDGTFTYTVFSYNICFIM